MSMVQEQQGRGWAPPRVAAAYLGISLGMLYKVMSEGQLRFAKVGKCRRIAYRDLDEFMERCTASPADPALVEK